MDCYQFLSDEWIAELQKIREEYRGKTQPIPTAVRLNQVITNVPFGDGTINSFTDTSTGEFNVEIGTLDSADATVKLDYQTATALFKEGSAKLGLGAFLTGKIKIRGDITKLSLLQKLAGNDPSLQEMLDRIKQMTC